MKIDVGQAQIEFLDSGGTFYGAPNSPYKSQPLTGTVSRFRVTTTDNLDLIFGVVYWPNQTIEVRHIDNYSDSKNSRLEDADRFLEVEYIDNFADSKYKRLEAAGRLGVSTLNGSVWFAEMRAMKHGRKNRPDLAIVTLEELSSVLGGDAGNFMRDHGALKVGSREEVSGDTGSRKNILSFTCEISDEATLAVAFTLTRVLTITRDFGMTKK
jgi:hypothetical protein